MVGHAVLDLHHRPGLAVGDALAGVQQILAGAGFKGEINKFWHGNFLLSVIEYPCNLLKFYSRFSPPSSTMRGKVYDTALFCREKAGEMGKEHENQP